MWDLRARKSFYEIGNTFSNQHEMESKEWEFIFKPANLHLFEREENCIGARRENPEAYLYFDTDHASGISVILKSREFSPTHMRIESVY